MLLFNFIFVLVDFISFGCKNSSGGVLIIYILGGVEMEKY